MVLSINKTSDSGRRNFLTHYVRKNYGSEVNVWATISTRGIIGPFFFDDTVTKERYKDTENSFIPISWQQVSLYTHSGSWRMEPVHKLQTWFLISCMRRLIFGFLNVMRVANCGCLIARILIHAISFYGDS